MGVLFLGRVFNKMYLLKEISVEIDYFLTVQELKLSLITRCFVSTPVCVCNVGFTSNFTAVLLQKKEQLELKRIFYL